MDKSRLNKIHTVRLKEISHVLSNNDPFIKAVNRTEHKIRKKLFLHLHHKSIIYIIINDNSNNHNNN